MFERSYGRFVTDIKIYDFPAEQMESMNLRPFQKLQQITLAYDHVSSQKHEQEIDDEDNELHEFRSETLWDLQDASEGFLGATVSTEIESRYHDMEYEDALVVGVRLKGCIEALAGMGYDRLLPGRNLRVRLGTRESRFGCYGVIRGDSGV